MGTLARRPASRLSAEAKRLHDLRRARARIDAAQARGDRPAAEDLVEALELSFGHTLTVHDWARILRGLLPRDYREPRPPALPTSTPPGSRARARVYEQRAARGRCLWHPLDLDAGAAQAALLRFAAAAAGGGCISLTVE